jgi:hypothetical protein
MVVLKILDLKNGMEMNPLFFPHLPFFPFVKKTPLPLEVIGIGVSLEKDTLFLSTFVYFCQ